jgi:hypothetical protein
MANQTISVNKNFDDASMSSLANNETLTINSGAILTFNSDNRWSQNAAAFGNSSIDSATGGKIMIDGTMVWQVPFTSSSGNVPALGTVGTYDISGSTSGCLGEFLGVWSSVAVSGAGMAPVAAAATMPTAGYVKMRRKSDTFTPGETINLAGGATIVASDAGKRSWLDIVGVATGTCTIPRLGTFEAQGDWYELGTTNGLTDQEFDYPFLGVCNGIQVETISGSGIYEWYAQAGDRWISGTASLGGPTDPRGKYFGQRAASITATTTNGSAIVPTTATTQLVVGMPINASANFANLAGYIVSINPGVSFTMNTNANAGASTTFITWRNKIQLARSTPTIVGYLPMSGCKVRCPNVRLSTTYSPYVGNALATTYADRYEFVTTSAGKVIVNKVECGWYSNFSGAYSLDFRNSTQALGYIIGNTAAANIIDNCISSYENATLTSGLALSNCYGGTTISNSWLNRYNSAAAGSAVTMTDCSDVSITDSKFSVGGQTNVLTTRGNAGINTALLTRCFRVSTNRLTTITGSINLTGCVDVTLLNTISADTEASTTTSTNPLAGVFNLSAGTANVLVDGYSLMSGLTNVHPYTAVIIIATGCSTMEFRNFGTAAAPINGGTVNPIRYIINAGVCLDLSLRRIYFDNTNFGFYMSSATASTLANTCQGVFCDNCWCDGADENRTAAVYQLNRGCRWTSGVTGQTSQYGKHIEDAFTSTTAGRVVFSANEPITETMDQLSTISGGPAYTSTGTVNMPLWGDTIEWVMPYFAIGHTALANSAPTLTGTNTGNFAYTYQIDTGSGWNGVWKTLDAATLSAETIPPYVDVFTMGGFKLKVRAQVTVPSATNALTAIRVTTVTTVDEYKRQYALRNPAVGYTDVASATALGIYDNTSGSLAGSTTAATSGSALVYPPWNADYEVTSRLRLAGYEPIEDTYDITQDGQTLAAVQNDWSTIPNTDPGALGIVVDVSASPMTWQSRPYSITIRTTNDALTAAQVANYINYNVSQLTSWNGYRGLAWGHMIEPDGTDFKTVRGRLFGSAGAAQKGVRVVRSDNDTAVTGFTQMQADDGTYYTLPILKTAAVTNIVPGSRLRVYNTTKAIEITNQVIAGTSWTLNYFDGPTTFDTGDLADVRLTYIPGISGYEGWRTTGVVSAAGLSVLAGQVPDAIYNGIGIDGSTVTEFTADYPNVQVDISDGDGTTTVQRLYAFFCYNETTADGIRYWFDAMTAPDAVNFEIDVATMDLKLDNTSASPVMIIGGRLYRSDGTTVIAATSGSIHLDPDKVYAIATGSGVTSQDKVDIAALTKTRMEEAGSKLTKAEVRTRVIPAGL